MSDSNILKMYGLLGKILCAGAGAIVGFVTGGIAWVAAGALLGAAFGQLLECAVG
jgi:hypothetical protein